MPTIGDRRREMQRTIDALREKLADSVPRSWYLDVADALLPESAGPHELVAEARRLREKLAEVERELGNVREVHNRDHLAMHMFKDQRDQFHLALAAEQADNARLREVLDRLRDLAEIGLPMKANLVYTITNAALAQSPPSNAALRQVCAQMGTEAVTAYIGGASEKAAVDKALEGVLGPEVAR